MQTTLQHYIGDAVIDCTYKENTMKILNPDTMYHIIIGVNVSADVASYTGTPSELAKKIPWSYDPAAIVIIDLFEDDRIPEEQIIEAFNDIWEAR